jgi:hypothetical protein
MQAKSIENIFNETIAENFPNSEKKRAIQVQQTFRKRNRQDQKRNTPRHIIVKILTIQNKKITLKLQERSDKSPIKANPSE